ncbi:hypothetical protein [Sphingomonas phyllosphaerae]|uniref:hypothetical protein n=1 Tax=Sphingomonas phyllosphaerae TaxID=257003 RepID=UPI00041B092F|nr:hypothetical protein [Sphingomonas phyllosphaerae]
MKIIIGAYDAATRTVHVTFEQGAIEHKRAVNACLDAEGSYDEAATAARVHDVARGVAQKILVGAITEPETIPQA